MILTILMIRIVSISSTAYSCYIFGHDWKYPIVVCVCARARARICVCVDVSLCAISYPTYLLRYFSLFSVYK